MQERRNRSLEVTNELVKYALLLGIAVFGYLNHKSSADNYDAIQQALSLVQEQNKNAILTANEDQDNKNAQIYLKIEAFNDKISSITESLTDIKTAQEHQGRTLGEMNKAITENKMTVMNLAQIIQNQKN